MPPRVAALHQRHCTVCRPGTPNLPAEAAESLLAQLDGWRIEAGKKLLKSFRFRNWKAAMAFANQISELAEAEGHHPDLLVSWGSVRVELTTHAAGGLTENDFVMAARIDKIGHAR
jgi:4a-hydroxytetrahydrobiopterin dehydratase